MAGRTKSLAKRIRPTIDQRPKTGPLKAIRRRR